MKTTYAVILCVLLLLVSACAPKVNDPADVQAIKKSINDFDRAVNAGDVGGIAALSLEPFLDRLRHNQRRLRADARLHTHLPGKAEGVPQQGRGAVEQFIVGLG